jgi:homoserine dehydrogenase
VNSVNDVRIGVLGLGTVGAGVVKILRPAACCRAHRAPFPGRHRRTDLTRPREDLDSLRCR